MSPSFSNDGAPNPPRVLARAEVPSRAVAAADVAAAPLLGTIADCGAPMALDSIAEDSERVVASPLHSLALRCARFFP